MTAGTSVGVIVLAHGAEPWLTECVNSVLASEGVEVELVVVDNSAAPEDIRPLRHRQDLVVLEPGTNTGFAGGCNLGAEHLTSEYLALVNSDCLLDATTLAQLVSEARRPDAGPVMASIRFAERPDVLNSSGNPVHLLGICWAGGLEETEHRTEPYDVSSASGACLVLRRELWSRLAGFDEFYFAYLEDTELSLRCRRWGLVPRCVPTAIARHHYEFSRNPTKMYLLERNRLLLLATMWPKRALLLLAPLLIAFEIALTLLAFAQGWGPKKVAGWLWLARNTAHVRARRRILQSERAVPQQEWMERLTTRFADHVIGSAAATRVVNAVVTTYWRLVRRLV
ncbi:glycosyltransferase family 2 protein [Actinomycetospora aeridis]|uniref:Glycosyltransferase family 2 protein n=1 Tax=Actinomycetospora aeridis TaxID=3129231 RepID=A0ABU8N2K2_9PSEU